MPKPIWNAAALTAFGLVALVLAACGRHAGFTMPPPQVGVVVAQVQSVPLTAELEGRVQAVKVSDVRPQISGVVKARLFTEGGLVKAGQPLYQIDPALYQAALDAAKANLAQAQAAYETAKLKADRSGELLTLNAISRQDNDDAQAAAKQAAANVQAETAAVEQAKINLDYTQVRAPISGRIGKSSVTPGALVTADQTQALATVQDLSSVYVDLTQSTADLLRLRQAIATGDVGRPTSAVVRLTLEDGSAYPAPGRLQFSDITVDEGTGTVGLRATFPNPDAVLLPGMYVRASVGRGVARSAILLPQAAVTRDAKGDAIVMVVDEQNLAQPRPVALGQMVGDQWLVLAGLKPGERVIVEGLQKVRPGGPVKPAVIGAGAG